MRRGRVHLFRILLCVMFFIGAWQLDLLVAPALWNTNHFVDTIEEPFYLPFNIPIHKQHAYVVFFGLMELAFILSLVTPYIKDLIKALKR